MSKEIEKKEILRIAPENHHDLEFESSDRCLDIHWYAANGKCSNLSICQTVKTEYKAGLNNQGCLLAWRHMNCCIKLVNLATYLPEKGLNT